MQAPLDGPSDAGAGRAMWLHSRIQPEESVVDLGGTGELLTFYPPERLTALDDLSGHGPGHVIRAGTFHKGDVCDLSVFRDQQFDVAVMTEVLEHVPLPWRAMEEAGRVAKRVLITVPCEGRWGSPIAHRVAGHMRFYTYDMMALHLRRAGLDGDLALLEWGNPLWSFLIAEVARA
jgi:hypothetical protein